ncbi:DUF3283 family protein [Vibrio marisflavi]|uniref:Pyridoxamine 5-phosphate oxidase n=1 Tax=Vibrio marisflavi CECT 7928 TaxID=634439 RepID=A0ABM9A227_9VIBR|nr:DUF3283 family protein [Vibrio marisflavi]CAH0537830.1 hypothetical protein VMF7928_01383 [Vibrio marisflavi CECT 7928]
MSVNLSSLPKHEKNRIELDKQASYLVWQLKHGESTPDAISTVFDKIVDEQEKEWFQNSIDKYKRMMNLV